MADYYAVLSRTLGGFKEPNEQLRTKLFERARITITKQLASRRPQLDETAMAVEMQKLEQAIIDIEVSFGGAPSTLAPPPVTTAPSAPPPPFEAQASAAPISPLSEHLPVHTEPEPTPPPLEIPEPVQPVIAETIQEVVETPEVDPAPEFETVPEIPKSNDLPLPDFGSDTLPSADLISDALSDFNEADETRKTEAKATREPMDLESEASFAAHLDEVLAIAPAPVEPDEPVLPDEEVPAVAPVSVAPVADLEPIDFHAESPDDALTIPPASGRNTPSGQSGGWMKWLIMLLIFGGIAVAAWMYQEPILTAIDEFTSTADSPTKPKPVKTISIKPDPVQPEPAVEEEAIAAPKTENRLSENGEEVQPVQPTQPIVVEEPSTSVDAQAKPDTGVQKAILYEEGGENGSGALDNGKVTWSLVQEAPAPGEAEEPAIRARVEIPGRKTVLIMTIKRNSDPALTASHLIELIFAVPDDFSGGAIESINRFVLKQSEQGRGDRLDAVPVKISDGIFLIALDNLAAAKTKNEALLKTRNWIDIPLQYRTGRRALMTIEKGALGTAVFEKAFAAWDGKQQ